MSHLFPLALVAALLAPAVARADAKISFEPDLSLRERPLGRFRATVTAPRSLTFLLATGIGPPPDPLDLVASIAVFVDRTKPPVATLTRKRDLTYKQEHQSDFEHDGRGPYDDRLEILSAELPKAVIDAMKSRAQPMTFVLLDAKGRTLFVADAKESDIRPTGN